MFTRQKQNKTALLILTGHFNWSATRTIHIHLVQTAAQRRSSKLEQMCLLTDHAINKQRCEIQWEALEFSEEHKWLV